MQRTWEKKLSPLEWEAMLNANVVGTLSLIENDRPYAVQLEYVFHEGALYMGTYFTGRKINCLSQNDRAVFTVFEDRHTHPEMIKKNIPCRSIMLEGRIKTIHVNQETNDKGVTKSYRLLKFDIESTGSWQCSRKRCHQVRGLDPKKILLDWIEVARRSEAKNQA